MNEAQQAWDEHYGERERVWSGRVNDRLAELAAGLTPGRVLDLGCGEGADALWLAEQGWSVVAVDISQIALQRAAEDAQARELTGRIQFEQHDLSQSFPAGTFDLVSAQFFHSHEMPDRTPVLQRAAAAIVPGGVLMIVDHEGPPPWAGAHMHEHTFSGPEEVIAALELDRDGWERVRVEAVDRQTVDPDGQTATLADNVIVLRRHAD